MRRPSVDAGDIGVVTGSRTVRWIVAGWPRPVIARGGRSSSRALAPTRAIGPGHDVAPGSGAFLPFGVGGPGREDPFQWISTSWSLSGIATRSTPHSPLLDIPWIPAPESRAAVAAALTAARCKEQALLLLLHTRVPISRGHTNIT